MKNVHAAAEVSMYIILTIAMVFVVGGFVLESFAPLVTMLFVIFFTFRCSRMWQTAIPCVCGILIYGGAWVVYYSTPLGLYGQMVVAGACAFGCGIWMLAAYAASMYWTEKVFAQQD